MTHLEDATRAALRLLELSYLRDEENGSFMVPIPVGRSAQTVVGIHVEEETQEALIETMICPVPANRRGAVALRLAELNDTLKFVTFSMDAHHVFVDVCVELAGTLNPEPVIGLFFIRLIQALDETHREITALAQRGRASRLSKAEKEVMAIIDALQV